MGNRRRWTRAFVAIIAAAGPALMFAAPSAHSETIASLKERMARIQEDLDANTARIEELRSEQYRLAQRINVLEKKIEAIEADNSELQNRAIDRARELYMGGSTRMLEILLSAQDIGELSAEFEYAARISDNDTSLFVRYSRVADELNVARGKAEEHARDLAQVEETLDEETEALQDRLVAAQDDYDALKKKLAAQAAREARREAAAEAAAQAPSVSAPSAPIVVPSGNMTCPVAGPNSFIDSWGYPRSGGRTHEGTDIMAAEGTPVVAITSGTITYAGYGSS
ncbi:MAG: murein hydrolase activator EnvC family protein, partial [Actinomycetota bacterium]